MLVVRSQVRFQGVRGLRPDSTKDPSCMWAWFTLNLTPKFKRPLACVAWKLGLGLPTQMSSIASDHQSKFTRLVQNSSLVASQCDVNITSTF
ncbi:hypothetical protein AVEN_110654-1 [Araneus ventricosus]|uniref:Uncharacterized protein n=1 Tax=Araneus ventricosus TaxID=182803 RepID=A0A4Y2AVN9_ARAVE|nr:hypothetical protein AVEN_110654-1 [Araneus ventricosus]